MEQPMDYNGPQLEILVRDTKQDNTAEIIDKLVSYIPAASGSSKVGIFLKDQEDGELTTSVL